MYPNTVMTLPRIRVKVSAIIVLLLTTVFVTTVFAEDPGLNALVQASTDIVVAKIISSSPRKAIEGARDNAMVQVTRKLKGPLNQGDRISVYYHLLVSDAKTGELEPKKFEVGKEYIVFIKSYRLANAPSPISEVTIRELTDQWLGVQRMQDQLEKAVLSQVEQSQKQPNQ